jgi:hypothetical protein
MYMTMQINKIKLFKIRNWTRGLSPLYISICAAMLLDLKSNIKFDLSSILYFGGLISFIIASIISNELANRCNNYGRIYDIKINDFQKEKRSNPTPPNRESIYENKENELNIYLRLFQYIGVFMLGISGLFFVIFSYTTARNQSDKFNDLNLNLQYQVDSLKSINLKYEEKISELKKSNDSIRNVCFDIFLLNNKTKQCSQSETDSIGNKY